MKHSLILITVLLLMSCASENTNTDNNISKCDSLLQAGNIFDDSFFPHLNIKEVDVNTQGQNKPTNPSFLCSDIEKQIELLRKLNNNGGEMYELISKQKSTGNYTAIVYLKYEAMMQEIYLATFDTNNRPIDNVQIGEATGGGGEDGTFYRNSSAVFNGNQVISEGSTEISDSTGDFKENFKNVFIIENNGKITKSGK